MAEIENTVGTGTKKKNKKTRFTDENIESSSQRFANEVSHPRSTDSFSLTRSVSRLSAKSAFVSGSILLEAIFPLCSSIRGMDPLFEKAVNRTLDACIDIALSDGISKQQAEKLSAIAKSLLDEVLILIDQEPLPIGESYFAEAINTLAEAISYFATHTSSKSTDDFVKDSIKFVLATYILSSKELVEEVEPLEVALRLNIELAEYEESGNNFDLPSIDRFRATVARSSAKCIAQNTAQPASIQSNGPSAFQLKNRSSKNAVKQAILNLDVFELGNEIFGNGDVKEKTLAEDHSTTDLQTDSSRYEFSDYQFEPKEVKQTAKIPPAKRFRWGSILNPMQFSDSVVAGIVLATVVAFTWGNTLPKFLFAFLVGTGVSYALLVLKNKKSEQIPKITMPIAPGELDYSSEFIRN